MRMFALLLVALVALACTGCTDEGVQLQPAVQGEWSNFHNQAHQMTKDAGADEAKAPAEK